MSVPLPPAIYSALVVALAIFFLGLTLLTPAARSFLVAGRIELNTWNGSDAPRETGRARAAASSLDSRQIALAAHAANARVQELEGELEEGQPIPSLTSHRPQTVSKRLNVTTEAASKDGALVLSVRDTHLPWAKAFIEHLMRQLVRGCPGSSRPASVSERAVRKAKWHVEQARHYERKARFDMEDRLNSHFEQVRDTVQRSVAQRSPDRSAEFKARDTSVAGDFVRRESGRREDGLRGAAFHPDESNRLKYKRNTATVDSPRKNPQWEHLQEQLSSLRHRLDELLQTATPTHPQARSLNNQIKQTQTRLSETPQYPRVSAGEERVASIQPAGEERNRHTSLPVSHALATESTDQRETWTAEVLNQYHRLRARYSAAVRRREAAERSLWQLQARANSETSQQPAGAACFASPRISVQRIGAVPSGGVVLTVGIVALVCGAFVYWWIATTGRVPAIYSVEQLQAVSPLPLVGRVSLGPMTQRIRRRPYWIHGMRWCIRLSEMALLAMILVFCWSVFQESPVFNQLLANPLGTIANRLADCCRGPLP